MKIYLKYRNYKPIHASFQSLINNPPQGVVYTVPEVKKALSKGFFIYRYLRDLKAVKILLRVAQKHFFDKDIDLSAYDLVQIIDHIPTNFSNYKFIADIGHIISLADYNSIDEEKAKKISAFLLDDNCVSIIARTKASKQTIANFANDFLSDAQSEALISKVEVVYPAVWANENKHEIYDPKKSLKILAVGNGVFNKGVHELISAVQNLTNGQNRKIKLTCVVSDYDELPAKFKNSRVNFYKPNFSKNQIINNFFLKHHIFVLPTHQEIFGMVFLDAYSVGLPVITIAEYATPEIVKDGLTGLLVKSDRVPFDTSRYPTRKDVNLPQFFEPEEKVVQSLEKAIAFFMDNPRKITVMGDAAYTLVNDGPFSIKERNKRLNKLYEKATAKNI